MYSLQYVVKLPTAMQLAAAAKFFDEFVAKVDSLVMETQDEYSEDMNVSTYVIEDETGIPVV